MKPIMKPLSEILDDRTKIRFTVSQEEYANLAAANIPGHPNQEAGALLKAKINSEIEACLMAYGKCYASIEVK